MEYYDKIVLGAGIYGLYSALKCSRLGQRILVLERDTDVFMRATYINQARVHMGYHYPRSKMTALKSAHYFQRFCEDYGFCIKRDFKQIYTSWRCIELDIWEESRIQYFYGTFNSIIAVFVFLATKAFFSIVGNRWETFNRFVAYFGSLSFGIMLIEHICRRTTTQLYDFLVRSFPPFLSCWMWILSAYLMGVAIVSVMKIIPCVKKLI